MLAIASMVHVKRRNNVVCPVVCDLQFVANGCGAVDYFNLKHMQKFKSTPFNIIDMFIRANKSS